MCFQFHMNEMYYVDFIFLDFYFQPKQFPAPKHKSNSRSVFAKEAHQYAILSTVSLLILSSQYQTANGILPLSLFPSVEVFQDLRRVRKVDGNINVAWITEAAFSRLISI